MPQMRKRDPAPRRDAMGEGTMIHLEMANVNGRLFRELDEPDTPEEDQSIKVAFLNRVLNLSHMTSDELNALQNFWNDAIDTARPQVERLDQRAIEARDAGTAIHRRLYRPIPVLADFRVCPDCKTPGGAHIIGCGSWASLNGVCPECRTGSLDHEIGCSKGRPDR